MTDEDAPPKPVETPGHSENRSHVTPAVVEGIDQNSSTAVGSEPAQGEPISTNPSTVDEPPKEHTREHWFRTVERAFSFLANVAVVVGIVFALYQIKQGELTERRRVAIEAVGQIRSAEFLKAYRKVKVAYHSKQVKEEDRDDLLDSLNHVMNVYDNIAVMYISDVADRCIIKNSIQSGAQEASEISKFLEYPPEYRSNLDSLLILMERENCGGKSSVSKP
jgi:HEAT repeat protein